LLPTARPSSRRVGSHQQIGGPLTGSGVGQADAMAFRPDGKTLAVGYDDGSVRVWDVATRRQLSGFTAPDADSPSAVAFSPDDKTLATATGDGSVRLWNVAARRQTGRTLVGSPVDTVSDVPVDSVAFSPDDKTLAIDSRDGTAQLWDAATQEQIGGSLTIAGDPIDSVKSSPDGKSLALGGTVVPRSFT
jgi:WD40 repeat protein